MNHHGSTRPAGRRGHMGGGMRGVPAEKPANFKGTWKKLLRYCRRYWPVMIIALLCAAVSTVFTLIGPDKLSELTDTITVGIRPDTERLTALSDQMTEEMKNGIQRLMEDITANFSDQEALAQKIPALLASDQVSEREKNVLRSMLTSPEDGQTGINFDRMLQLSDEVFNSLYHSVVINGSTLTPSEQFETLVIFSAMSDGNTMQQLSRLPASARAALYQDITIDGVTISAADQQKMTELLSGIDEKDPTAAMKSLSQMPDSVRKLTETSIDLSKVLEIGLFLVILYSLSFFLSSLQGFLMATVTQRVSKRMRSDISGKINRLPMRYYHEHTTGDVLSRVTNDVDTIGQSLNQSIGNLITSVVMLFGSLFMMIKTNGILTLTAIGASLIGFILMFLIMGKSQKYFTRQQKHLGDINGHIEEMFTGHTVVKAYNGEDKSRETFDEMNNRLRDSGFKAQCLSGTMMPMMNFIGNFGYVAVCVVGGALALNGSIGFGTIVAFILYVRFFTQPLSQIAQTMQSLQSAAAAGERVFEFLEAEEMEKETDKPALLAEIRGNVDFSHIRFGYPGSDKTIIHNFTASARPGQKIAIVGPTGAGKTTLVNLLMRFYEIDEGEIRIDGIPTRDVPRENVRSCFCMVLQDTWLFEGTLRENLVYNTENVSEETIRNACKAVGLYHFIKTLPKGLDTVLNDNVSLSQGQRQQLTIARAMIADRPMLILDEATSSVDTRTELKIQQAMDQLMENRTSFIIAHRLSTIKNADLILVLKDGDIIESGTHQELMAQKGFYHQLYNSQFLSA